MALNSTTNVSDILNRVAAEVGELPVDDPLASTDPFFMQLRYLLVIAGEELMQAYPWEMLIRTNEIITDITQPNEFDLPADFGYMMNQTAWELNSQLPMGNPLSAQQWTYLKGRNLISSTIYANFRISEGKFNVFPNNAPAPPSGTPQALDITFEYISSNWVWDGNPTTPTYKKTIDTASDTPLFDRTLISRALKVKYLEAAGFDTSKAQADYNQIFAFLTGTEKGAPVLNAGGGWSRYRYLNGDNVPFTGFGGV